jgi:CheY-like chemotaxis protein
MFHDMPMKKLVFYVDDDHDDILLLEDVFKTYSHIELVCFTDSYKFLKYVIDSKPFRRPPSLILIDINMPVINGRELLTMLRSYDQLKETKMVLYTTSNLPADNHFANNQNAGFITKPISYNQLEETIQQLLKGCNLLDTNGEK